MRTYANAFTNNPIFGAGLGSETNEFQSIIERSNKENLYSLSHYDTPHNQYISYLVSLGLVGFGLFILIHFQIYNLKFHSVEMKHLSLIFLAILIVNCLSDEIIFIKHYNSFYAIMVTLFFNLSIKNHENFNHSK